MARSPNQKLKTLILQKTLLERTDEEHPMTVKELIDTLAAWDVTAERKSIYDDLEALRQQIMRDAEEARSYFAQSGIIADSSAEN